jgi:hypothetical protein
MRKKLFYVQIVLLITMLLPFAVHADGARLDNVAVTDTSTGIRVDLEVRGIGDTTGLEVMAEAVAEVEVICKSLEDGGTPDHWRSKVLILLTDGVPVDVQGTYAISFPFDESDLSQLLPGCPNPNGWERLVSSVDWLRGTVTLSRGEEEIGTIKWFNGEDGYGFIK